MASVGVEPTPTQFIKIQIKKFKSNYCRDFITLKMVFDEVLNCYQFFKLFENPICEILTREYTVKLN